MHRFLLLDTTHTPYVAVFNEETFERQKSDAPRGSEVVVALISEALQDAGVAFSDLSAILVITGPGSFTGTRVGVSVGNALHLARGTPTLGLSWHHALALSFETPKQFQVYQKMSKTFSTFQTGKAGIEPSPLSFEKTDLPVYGDTLESGEGTTISLCPHKIFHHYLLNPHLLQHTSLKPLYAHAPDIHTQNHKALKRV